MAIERTLSIIKPNAISKNIVSEIYKRFDDVGLKIIIAKKMHLNKKQAEGFYAEHKKRPFFSELITFMTSGPIIVQVIEAENAIQHHREMMGATDPKKALPGTLRSIFAESITKNAIHGSDSIESAQREISYFFTPDEFSLQSNYLADFHQFFK